MPEQNPVVNVLWLVSWYPTEINVSLGDFIQRQALAASKYCSITLVGFFPHKGSSAIQIDEKIQNEYLKEIIIYYPDKGKGWVKLFYRTYYILSAALHIYNYTLKAQKPQLIHLHILHPMSLIGLFYAVLLRIPLVISEHASVYFRNYRSMTQWFRRRVERMAIKKSKAVIVVSEALQKAMEMQGINGNFRIIPNVVDAVFFSPPAKIKKKNKVFQWIHTSTLAEGIKDIEGILSAVKLLSLTRQDFFVTFLGGTSSLVQKYSNIAADMGISSFVLFQPEKSQDEMAMVLQHADAYINFSKMETFGLSVIEALAAGLPCIATRTGIFDQWINDQTGILVKSGNIGELVAAMMTLMDRFDTYDPAHVISQIETCYSADMVGKNIAVLYNEFINREK